MPKIKNKNASASGAPKQQSPGQEYDGINDAQNEAGQIPNEDLRGTKDEQKYARAADRGFSNSPKALYNQFKNKSNLHGLKNLSKIQPDLRKHENMSQQAKQQFKKAAGKAIKKGIRTAEKELAPETFGLSVIVGEAIIHWRTTIILIIALFLILFALFDSSTFDVPQNQNQKNDPTTSDTCSPPKASFGQTSVCTITVTYNGSADNIVITDTILPGTGFVSAGQKGTYNKTANTVTWDAKKLNLPLNPVNITVTVTVRITTHQNNIKVWNAYSIDPTNLSASSAGGGAAIPGNLPPSTNNCSGIYAHYMGIEPSHKNYGDPTCTLIKKDANGTAFINKDAILAELKTLKSSEAMGWFICVVPHESGYNANAYLGASTSGKGAYGLVQMNPTGKGNGQYDNGEVVWPLQLSNGINYNDKVITHTFTYWPTSYDPC